MSDETVQNHFEATICFAKRHRGFPKMLGKSFKNTNLNRYFFVTLFIEIQYSTCKALQMNEVKIDQVAFT